MTVDFAELMKLWDQQQNYYMKYREDRYTAMFDLLEASMEPPYRLIDLASGTGSLSLRFLNRFPSSETVMIDQDPVLLRISRENFHEIKGKHTWIRADISDLSGIRELEPGSFHAIMSTTALHWLDSDSLSDVYRQCFKLLRAGGIFLNGDHLHSVQDSREFEEMEKKISELHRNRTYEKEGQTWEGFWEIVSNFPGLAEEMEERNRIYPPGWSHGHNVTLEEHIGMLEKCGFEVPGAIWSNFSDRILLARKPLSD